MKQIMYGALFSSIFAVAQHQAPYQPQYIAVPVVLHLHTNAYSSATVDNHPRTEIVTTTQIQQPQPVASNTDLTSLYHALTQYLKDHWLFCSLVATGVIYTLLCTYLMHAHYCFSHAHHWSTWQAHQTMEQLMQQPDTALETLLIKEIAATYVNPQNPTDSLWPLTQFLMVIKEEERALKRYLTVANLIKKTPLWRIFPTLHDREAEEALTRLHFVHHLFISWSADLTWTTLNQIG